MEDHTGPARARAAYPHLNALAAHVNAFAEILTSRLIAGLRRDHDSVLNGLALTYSSGVVEGHVSRIKMIKRQMYGRANLDLLRKRILLA